MRRPSNRKGKRPMEKKILSLDELSGEEIKELVKTAIKIKKRPARYANRLKGKTLLLLFQKTSTRTRLAFELGMEKLGGKPVVMDWGKSNFSISPLKYEAMYVGSMVDSILARLVRHEDAREFARSVEVPFINGCCNMYHPSQALADLMTVYEVSGGFQTSLTYVGVRNNVANSLFYGCLKTGVKLTFVTPLKDELPPELSELEGKGGTAKSGSFEETLDLEKAVASSEFVYTDAWINMEDFHDENKKRANEERIGTMIKYQVNRKLIEGKGVYVMHDMPVHPGLEIDDYAITCEHSLVLRQAQNRMYSGQALLLYLLDAL